MIKRRSNTSHIGWQCKLKWQDQEVMATIISERINSNKKLEYYLHFGTTDTKYDTWIDAALIEELYTTQFTDSYQNDKGSTLKKIVAYSEGKPLTLEEYPIKNIYNIYMDEVLISCWYPSPYPDYYYGAKQLLICPNCFQFFQYLRPYNEHKEECRLDQYFREDNLIYYKDSYLVYEMNGEKDKLFSQNLCLFSKLFISHKDICYNTKNFYFYILVTKPKGQPYFRPVSYFSKERMSIKNNLACILTFPHYQNNGYGTFMIEFSYKLSIKNDKMGSPERPLSKSGFKSYLKFWCATIADILISYNGQISLSQISKVSYIMEQDILLALGEMGLLPNNWDLPLILDKYTILDALEGRKILIRSMVEESAFLI